MDAYTAIGFLLTGSIGLVGMYTARPWAGWATAMAVGVVALVTRYL